MVRTSGHCIPILLSIHERMQLDTAEQKLALAASYIRTIKNSHVDVCKLPAEVLDHIFAFAASQANSLLPLSQDISLDYLWKRWHPSFISGVCRYWRTVTLSFPSIWSTIYLGDVIRHGNLPLAQLCLRRSYGTSLNVYIDYNGPISPDALSWISEDLAAQSVRFRSFYFRSLQVDERLLTVFIECPAPHLHSLAVELGSPTQLTVETDLPTPVLFAGFLPNLKHLSISSFPMWPGYHLSQLTHICLNNLPIPVTASQILDILRSNLQIELLQLESIEITSQVSEDESQDHAEPVVTLPYLRAISMCGYTSTFCVRLLNAVRPSATVALQLNCRRTTTAHTLLSALARLSFTDNIFAIRFSTNSGSPFKDVDDPPSTTRLRLRGSGASSFDIGYSADIHEAASNQYMAALLSLLSACTVREVWLERDLVVAREPLWQRIYFALPLVTKLVLGPWSCLPGDPAPNTSCLSALCIIDETLGRALPCPLLEEVVIIGQLNSKLNRWLSPELRDFLETRRARGFPVRKVTVVKHAHEDLTRKEEDLARLRRLVTEVEWLYQCRDGTV